MKKTSLFIGLFLCLALQVIQAQELQVVGFKPLERDIYARTHERLDINEVPCAVVKVSVANSEDYKFDGNIIGDVIYQPGEAIVYMTHRTRKITIHSDRFGLLTYEFPLRLEKSVTYELDLKLIIPEDQKRRTLVMAEMGYHPSQTSFGAMVGVVAKHGAYLRFRSDFGSASADLECDDSGRLSTGEMPYYKEGASSKARLSVTGGYLCRIFKPLYGYVGAGYGQRTLAWETTDGELVKNTDHSASGIAAEIGVIGRFKKVGLSVGCQTVNFKYMELSAGVGFFF